MNEYSTGIDPEVKRYFRKIMKTFAIGLLWMLVMGTSGLFFKLAIIKDGWHWFHIVFYAVFLVTLIGVIFIFYRVWHKQEPAS